MGRAAENELSGEQPFYLRFVSEHLTDDGVTIDAIKVPNTSVNCSQFSEPEDVLLPDYGNQGVAQFYMRDLPSPMRTGIGSRQEVEYTFVVQHDPKCNPADDSHENYAHAEVRFLKNGEFHRDSKINSSVKFDYRTHMANKISIVVQPKLVE